MFVVVATLLAMLGGAGAIAAGEPAEDGVDTAGDAILPIVISNFKSVSTASYDSQ